MKRIKATRRDAGRKGGLATLKKHGRGQLAEWGRRGGRPPALTYDDIRQRQLCEPQNSDKEVKGTPGNRLNGLKKLWELRRGVERL